tara:strand:+ start:32588 stop:33757 length:1170 start_codon:yes stop_codon:yes gene_type:complete
LISVVIPAFNDSEFLEEVLTALQNQTFNNFRVIVVDSSTNKDSSIKIEQMLQNTTLDNRYKKINRSYAGRSMNVGIDLVEDELIGFLDTKTVPEDNWLESYLEIINKQYDGVFGVTKYEAHTNFQELLKAASYGNIGHQTVPGTIVKKYVLNSEGRFLENTRAAYDQEWKAKVKERYNFFTPKKTSITYSKLPENLFSTIKKYLLYTFHLARVQVERNLKEAYLSLGLFLLAALVTRWNFLWEGWDESPLYIDDITKIFLLSIIFLLIVLVSVDRILPSTGPKIFLNTLKFLAFVLISYGVYRWNSSIADHIESALLYVPHITKAYLVILFLISVFYRGLYSPLTRNVSKSSLFPLNWMKVGMLGLVLDLIKAPGYFIGALLSVFRFIR